MAKAYRVFLCFCVCLQLVHCQLGQTCTTVYNTTGACKDYYSCAPFKALLKQIASNPAATEILKKANCGFKNNIPQICCPVYKDANTNWIIDKMEVFPTPVTTLPPSTLPPVVTTTRKTGLLNVNSSFGETCTTVYNTTGACKDLYICASFMALLKQVTSNPAAKETLKKAHCGFKNNIPQICCPVYKDANTNRIIDKMEVFPTPVTTLPPSTLPPVLTTTRKSGLLNVNSSFGETCTTVYNTTGACKDLYICASFMALLKQVTSNPAAKETLKKAHCGFKNNIPQICCPVYKDANTNRIIDKMEGFPTPVMTLPPSTLPPVVTTTRKTGLLNVNSSFGETCTTVYNTTGACKELYICAPFMALLKQVTSNPAAKEILKKARCGFKNNIPQVCCPVPGQPTSLPPVVTSSPSSPDSRTGGHFIKALPEPPVCGWSNVTMFLRVVNGVPAKLGAFPWMAVLGYNNKLAGRVEWKCSGSLISIRHVLTAAHCIHTLEDQLFNVRLGELDLSREDEGATPIDIPIAEMIKHESYTRNQPTFHDIGILVLQRDVEFTDLIRPICLLVDKESRSESYENYNPFIAGWGSTKWNGVAASHLQLAVVSVLEDEACKRAYVNHTSREDSELFLSQALCAGFTGGMIDSCNGDSGGPLMVALPKEEDLFFYEIGVVSAGYRCAITGSPGIYARVSYYMPWIEQKVLGSTIP